MTTVNHPKSDTKVSRVFSAMLAMSVLATALQWGVYIQLAWMA